MAGTSAGARKGWLTRRGQRLPRDPQQRARIAAIEEHAAGTFAGPLRSGAAARTRAPQPAPARSSRGEMTYEQFAAEVDRLLALGHAGNANAPGAAAHLMGQHRNYMVRFRREHPELYNRPAPAAPARPVESANVRKAREEYERAQERYRARHFTEDETEFTNVQAALHRAAEKLKAEQKHATRPAPAAPARPARSDAGYERFKAERRAIVEDMRERGDADPQRLFNHGARNRKYLARYLAEMNGAPAAPPAKSSPPVRGQRVRVGGSPRSDAGYEEFVRELERRNARGVNFGPTSAQAYADAHRGYMARYRREKGSR